MASFLAIARLGNFRSAARELGISQGAISQHLQKLEGLLGVRLVDRDPKGCRLTVEGVEFQASAQDLMRLATNVLNSFHRRQLTIGASSNIGIYLLHPYLKAYAMMAKDGAEPEVRIAGNVEVAERLACGDVDLAVMEWWDGRPGYVARVWRTEALVAIVAPEHPWAGQEIVTRDQLLATTLLGGEPGTGTGRLLADYLGVGLSDLPIGKRLGSTAAIKQWVKAGMGISLVLEGTVDDEVRAGALVSLTLEGNPPHKPLYVAWRDSLAETHPALRFGIWLSTQDGLRPTVS